MKVRTGQTYTYDPNLMDLCDPKTTLKPGDQVRVVKLPGCPPPNTMNHCHVERLDGSWGGLVSCNSLTRNRQRGLVDVPDSNK